MKRKFKIALIGCGVISDNHLAALTVLDNIEIVALVDIDIQKAAAKKEKYNLDCRLYDEYREMLDREHVDAIHVLTPHYLHTEMTLEALARDVNVFLEKPLCIKEEDIEKIICAEKNSNATVCVSFQTRYNEAVKLARRLADEDGGVRSAYATVIWNRSDEYYKQGDWRGKWATEGGGVMINQAIHTLDLLCIFLGIPKNVQALSSKLRQTSVIEVEDCCECIINFDNGTQAVVFATTDFCGADTTTIHLETENHTIEIHDQHIYLDGKLIDTPKPENYVGKKCYGSGHAPLIASFYKSLEDGTSSPIPPTDAQHAVRIILGAYKSNGKIIEI